MQAKELAPPTHKFKVLSKVIEAGAYSVQPSVPPTSPGEGQRRVQQQAHR